MVYLWIFFSFHVFEEILLLFLVAFGKREREREREGIMLGRYVGRIRKELEEKIYDQNRLHEFFN